MIPKIFHKIWIGPKEETSGYSDTWLKHFPNYELKIWDNKTSKTYIEEMITLLGEVPKCSFNFVSDVLRLLITRDYGGIYLDHDVEIIKNFSELLHGSKTYLTFQYPACDNPPKFKLGTKMTDILTLGIEGLYEGDHNSDIFINKDDYINACMIISEPNSPVITSAIDLYLRNYFARDELKYGMSDWGYGPQVLSHSAELYDIVLNGQTQSNDMVTVFERSLFHPLHGVERLNNKEKYYNDMHMCKKLCYTFHHHSFTNMKEYRASIGTDEFNINAEAFTRWYLK